MFDENLKKIGDALIKGCREGTEKQGLQELYAKNAVSVEALAMPGQDSPEAHGIQAIQDKHEWWENAHEIHSAKVEGPFFHGKNQFSAIFELDVTNKEMGERMQMKEVGVYTVENDKIVREEFFYNM